MTFEKIIICCIHLYHDQMKIERGA